LPYLSTGTIYGSTILLVVKETFYHNMRFVLVKSKVGIRERKYLQF